MIQNLDYLEMELPKSSLVTHAVGGFQKLQHRKGALRVPTTRNILLLPMVCAIFTSRFLYEVCLSSASKRWSSLPCDMVEAHSICARNKEELPRKRADMKSARTGFGIPPMQQTIREASPTRFGSLCAQRPAVRLWQAAADRKTPPKRNPWWCWCFG